MVGAWLLKLGTHFFIAPSGSQWSVRKPITARRCCWRWRSGVLDGQYGLLDGQLACEVVTHGVAGLGV